MSALTVAGSGDSWADGDGAAAAPAAGDPAAAVALFAALGDGLDDDGSSDGSSAGSIAGSGDEDASDDGAAVASAGAEVEGGGDRDDGGGVTDDDDGEALAADDANEARYGLGVRLRYVHMPTAGLELFAEDTPGGDSHPGFGVELTREQGSVAITLGVEYETIAPKDGIYVGKGDRIPENTVDYIEYEDFDWISADLSIIWQPRIIGDVVSLRFGGGLGLGYLTGEMLRTDYVCTGTEIESCSRDPQGELDRTPDSDVPPVVPIINLLAGLKIQPFKNLAIHLEGGLRTIPFAGTTVSLLF
ncbi:MAG: hypothetical protein Tsb0020_47490 [Haliangiales bacterium]